jgi:hypothetical protein
MVEELVAQVVTIRWPVSPTCVPYADITDSRSAHDAGDDDSNQQRPLLPCVILVTND